jgi:hypothetical protein
MTPKTIKIDWHPDKFRMQEQVDAAHAAIASGIEPGGLMGWVGGGVWGTRTLSIKATNKSIRVRIND